MVSGAFYGAGEQSSLLRLGRDPKGPEGARGKVSRLGYRLGSMKEIFLLNIYG
jgi:hypothetical protein